MTTKLTTEQQKVVLDWPRKYYIPVLECDSRRKKVWLPEWQKLDLNNVDWQAKLLNGCYDNGIAIRLGRCLSNGKQELCSFALDFDDWDAVEVWFGSWENVLAWANNTRIEWHEDRRKLHMIFLAGRPVANRKIKIKNALLEVKCEGQLLFVHPSVHPDGNTWKPLGTEQIALLDNMQLLNTEAKIDSLSEGYMSDENKETYEKWLDDPDTILGVGQGRHDALKFKINSYYYKYKDGWLDLTDEQRFQRAWDWNIAHCKPAKTKEEFDSLVEWTIETHRETRDTLHKKAKEEKKNKPKQAERVVEISEKLCKELFHDQYQTPYAAVISGDHIESLPIGSKRFKNYICGAYYEQFGSVPNSESITGAINVLKYKAVFKGHMITLHLRVASSDGNDFLYDLTDAGWNVIRVTPQRWNIEKSPIIFRRYSSQLGQVLPSRKYEDDIFDQFMKLLNIEDNDSKLLLKCYIIALLVPRIQKAILMLHGEQGSAKTTLQELIKTLVDPSNILTLAFPRDINEFIQGLAHNYVVYFDNISNIREWISDILCRAVTGSGFSKRMLYSDDDDIIYNFKRCIGFNGINLAATKADLLDRGLIIQLSKISKDKRRENEEIWAEFEIIRPKLLGYIFDILVKVLASISSVKLSELPRMADFAKVCETISRCMGNEPDVFIKAYERNIQLQTEQVLESNIIAPVILKLMDTRQEWIGSATALLSNMETLAATMKVNTKSTAWPKGPNVLIRRLNEVKATLEDFGIFITRGLDTQSKVKTVEIRKKPLLPLPSLQGEKSVQITSDSGNDTGNDTPIRTEISLLKEGQKHAQIGERNASNDSNDTLRGYESYNKNIFSNRYVAFDFEWSQESSSTLLAAAFVDSDRNTNVLYISDYSGSANPEAELIKTINQQLLTYDYSIGWYSTGVARYHEDTQEYLDGVDSSRI